MRNRLRWTAVPVLALCIAGLALPSAPYCARAAEAAVLDDAQAQLLGLGRLYPFSVQDGTEDLYYFTTTAKRSYYQIKALLTSGSALHIAVCRPDGTVEAEFDLADQGYRRLALEPSAKYFLQLSGESGTAGEIVGSEIVDDHADTREEAAVMKTGQEYTVTAEGPGDVDYLRFSTGAEDVTYSLVMDSVAGVAAQYEVQDENGETVASYAGSTNAEKKLTKKLPKLEPEKTYYIKFTCEQDVCRLLVKVKKATNKYTIAYHLKGGINHKENPGEYTADQTVALKEPARKGYLFDGWYTDKDYKGAISGIEGSSKQNYDLYAKWTKVKLAKVSIQSFTSTEAGKAALEWKAVAGSSGYQLCITRKVNGKTKTVYKLLKGTSVKYSGWAQGEKYTVAVRAFGIDSCGERIYGAYSKKKTVTVRKKAAKKKK